MMLFMTTDADHGNTWVPHQDFNCFDGFGIDNEEQDTSWFSSSSSSSNNETIGSFWNEDLVGTKWNLTMSLWSTLHWLWWGHICMKLFYYFVMISCIIVGGLLEECVMIFVTRRKKSQAKNLERKEDVHHQKQKQQDEGTGSMVCKQQEEDDDEIPAEGRCFSDCDLAGRMACRLARFYKCERRRHRRKHRHLCRQLSGLVRINAHSHLPPDEDDSDTASFWFCNGKGSSRRKNHRDDKPCPLAALLRLPPPLPFRKRRRGGKPKQEETEPPITSDSAPVTLSDSQQETLSSRPDEKTEQQPPKIAQHDLSSMPATVGTEESRNEVIPTLSSTSEYPDKQEKPEKGSPSAEKLKRKKKRKHKKRRDGDNTATTAERRSSRTRHHHKTRAAIIPPSSLMDWTRMQHWSKVITHADPVGASHEDTDGLLALHWACASGSAAPIGVFEALLQANPAAIRHVDHEGSTPLHFATHYSAGAETVQSLLHANADCAAMRDGYGRTPLHHAITKGASIETLKILVETNASVLFTPIAGTPTTGSGSLSSSTKDFQQEREEQQQQTTPLFLAWYSALCHRPTMTQRSGKIWDKAMLLLQAAYQHVKKQEQQALLGNAPRQDQQQQDSFQMLHAVAALHTHLPALPLLHLALDEYPNQIYQVDRDTGRLPLAIAAAASSATRWNDTTRHVLETLLKAHPRALKHVDYQGHGALSLALQAGLGWKNGIQSLFMGAPDLLHSRSHDGRSLYPALAAAAAMETGNNSDGPVDDREEEDKEQKERQDILASSFARHYDNKKRSDWRQKQQQRIMERLTRPNPQSKGDSNAIGRDANQEDLWSAVDQDLHQLSTVYLLLQANPAVVAAG